MNGMKESIADNAERTEEQRKTLIVKPKFQQKMLLEVVLITFILVNTIVTVGYFLMDSLAGSYHLKETLSITIASIEILGFVIIYHLNLKSSNKIAGPIYNLEGCLSSVESGNLMTEMKMRDNDEFQEMSRQFNATTKSLRTRLNQVQFLADQIKSEHEGDPKVQELVDQLEWFNTHTAIEDTNNKQV